MDKQLYKLRGKKDTVAKKLEKAKKEYKYQQELTAKLDTHSGDFTQHTILEIVLWKTNRYPDVTPDLLQDINDLRKNFSEEKARNLLRKLLNMRGADLSMASTIMRFACPNEFQIIDQRVYRLITPRKDNLKIPHNKEEKIALYFRYLEKLKEVCREYGIDFHESDRILYQLDKINNKNINIH